MELTEEKTRLERLLNNTGKEINKWIEIAENVFAFASQAKERFETGGLEVKRQILSALGSDLLLKDKKLSICLDNALIPMKRVAKEANKNNDWLAPPKNVGTKGKTGDFSPEFPALLRGPELHRRLEVMSLTRYCSSTPL